jgi:hypothetical protein
MRKYNSFAAPSNFAICWTIDRLTGEEKITDVKKYLTKALPVRCIKD